MAASDAEIRFETRPAHGGRSVGVVHLARPARINALTVAMCEAMLVQLGEWASDESIACVLVAGEGDKGFCSGGDVVAAVRAIRSGGPARHVAADRLFASEYRLVQAIFEFAKPVVSLAHGITMGAGLGLAVAASHRVATRGVRMAMPESRIGLFPDVGAAWFLGRAPAHAGPLLALAGTLLDAGDAAFCGLVDCIVADDARDSVPEALAAVRFTGDARADAALVAAALDGLASGSDTTPGPVQARYAALGPIGRARSVQALRTAVAEAAQRDAWFNDALAALDAGSPTSLAVGFEHFTRMRGKSLRETLATDLTLARAFVRGHDFPEGVRAALIDKDRRPRWHPALLAEVTAAIVDAHFRD